MSGLSRWTIVVIALVVSWLTVMAASAQVGPPTSPGPGTPVPLPKPIVGPSLVDVGSPTPPFDFIFTDSLYGSGFKPGEQVTVTIEGGARQPVTAVADGSGTFEASLRYTWVFCGPHASYHGPPTFHAVGNQGSIADLTKPSLPCPDLASLQQQLLVPTPGPGGSGTAIAGTAVAGTAVVITAVPSTPGAVPRTPHPWPTPQPFLLTFDVWGFGFALGEKVTVQETNISGIEPLPSVGATADTLGRLHGTLQAYVRRCSPPPLLVAHGDQGTTVTAPLNWRDLIMVPCPAPVVPIPSSTVPQLTLTPPPGNPGQPARVLRFATAPGYGMAVAGRRWGRSARLSFALSKHAGTGWIRSSIVLQATGSGSFLVGVSHVHPCAGLRVTVHDRVGHVVRLRTLSRSCASISNQPKPVLTVLQGKFVAHTSL
jgi:hypothetical protein